MKNISLSLLLSLASPMAIAQIINYNLESPQNLNQPLEVNFPSLTDPEMALGDLNGDGFPDMVIMGESGLNHFQMQFFLNDGQGNFTERESQIIQCCLNRQPLHLVDIDTDGDLDIFMRGDRCWLNDGSGQFSMTSNFGVPVYMESILRFEDVDFDGDQDLFIAGSTSSTTAEAGLYFNDGTGQFTASSSVFEAFTDGDCEFIDFDSDGDLDIVYSGESIGSSSASAFWAYTNDGQWQFSLNPSISPKPLDEPSLHVADMNGDGYEDFIYGGTSRTKLYSSDGQGGFSEVIGPFFQSYAHPIIRTADLDGDGDLDMYLAGNNRPNSRDHYVYKNLGNNAFTTVVSRDLGSSVAVSQAHMGDVDQDGDIDLLLESELGMKLFVNSGAAEFLHASRSTIRQAAAEYRVVRTADMDGNGLEDLILAGTNYTATEYPIAMCFNSGTGLFKTVVDTTIRVNEIRQFEIADMNGDGTPDVIVSALSSLSNFSHYSFKIYFNDGTGILRLSYEYPHYFRTSTLNAFDSDKDGDVDILITGQDSTGAYETRLLLNNGNGDFISSGHMLPHFEAPKMAVGDIDNDGDIDIVIGGRDSSYISHTDVYLNDGLGNYAYDSSPFLFSTDPHVNAFNSYQLVDMDGDGDLDVLFNFGKTALKVFYNNGQGDFGSGIVIRSNSDPLPILALDADRDGDMDLLRTLRNPSTDPKRTVLSLNHSNGFTDYPETQFDDVYCLDMLTSDLDNDGDEDVVLAGRYKGLYPVIQVYWNNSYGISIEEVSQVRQNILYPNPSRGAFTIEWKTTQPEIDVQIIDQMGRVVQESQFKNTNHITVQSTLPPGVYWVLTRTSTVSESLPLIIQ